MAPFMILFFMFTILPVVMSMVLSFTYFNILEPPRFIGWYNYVRLFLEDDVFLIAIKNTFFIGYYNRTHQLYIGIFICLAY